MKRRALSRSRGGHRCHRSRATAISSERSTARDAAQDLGAPIVAYVPMRPSEVVVMVGDSEVVRRDAASSHGFRDREGGS